MKDVLYFDLAAITDFDDLHQHFERLLPAIAPLLTAHTEMCGVPCTVCRMLKIAYEHPLPRRKVSSQRPV